MANRKAPGFSWQDSAIQSNLKAFDPRVDAVVATAVQYHGTGAVGLAKTNARWTDRTGNARNGLGVSFNHVPGRLHGFALFHRVPYGIWLEVRWSGKYAIIEQTIRQVFPKLMNTIRSQIGVR